MTTTVTKPADVGAVMLERVTTVLKMNKVGLPLKWLQEFDAQTLQGACSRMENVLGGQPGCGDNFQREFIQNPRFADFYTKLLQAIGNESYDPPHLQIQIGSFLPAFWLNARDIADVSPRDFLEALDVYSIDESDRLIYLNNFADTGLTPDEMKSLAYKLKMCKDVPLNLTEKQKEFLLEPFVPNSELCRTAAFTEVFDFLMGHPDLMSLARLLHKNSVSESLTIEEYRRFAQPGAHYVELLNEIISTLHQPALNSFFKYWGQNGYVLSELKNMKRLLAAKPDEDWEERLYTRVGYINALYGVKFKSIDLAEVPSTHEGILIYAIANNKKHFIRLVNEHPEQFLELPAKSILLDQEFYEEHFNLNELTEKDLAACENMVVSRLYPLFLKAGRRYTFPEIRALHVKPEEYAKLYHALTSDSQDYRLRVFRQVYKRSLLDGLEENEVTDLAAKLSIKPLSDWIQAEFRHIDGLLAKDAVQLLIHFDQCRHLLPSMATRLDALVALRSLESLARFTSMEELQNSLMQTDPHWPDLAKRMGLSGDFQERNRDNILDFLCNDGANIAMSYIDCLDDERRTAYKRVIKAELMGRFRELKYHGDDLSQELGMQLPKQLIENWQNNLQLTSKDILVKECDDFFSTMLAGIIPQRTCISYDDGEYRDCLLAGFDANKKLLYAEADGKILGRAYLRLTKARRGSSEKDGGNTLTFADLEQPANTDSEQPVLFLERPYISKADPGQQYGIIWDFLQIAAQKAEQMGVMLIANRQYAGVATDDFVRTHINLYISRSKAGRQYLDSLGGQAVASEEGSYFSNSFLIKASEGV